MKILDILTEFGPDGYKVNDDQDRIPLNKMPNLYYQGELIDHPERIKHAPKPPQGQPSGYKGKKFHLTHESNGLYRIVASSMINTPHRTIKIAERGGLVSSIHNLSQDGNCWIFPHAKVVGNAVVSGNAIVDEQAVVSGNAIVTGRAIITGGSEVSGNAKIGGNVKVSGHARVTGGELNGDQQLSNNDFFDGKKGLD